MKTENRSKTNTTAATTKGKKVRGLSTKSGTSTNKGSKLKRKTAGGNKEEFKGQCLLSSTPPMSPSVLPSVPREASLCFQKFKLQLFPIDDVACRGLEKEKHNPFLELIIGTRKKISSVVKHLNLKWGRPKMASGELMLFPYCAQPENLSGHKRWTLKDSDISAIDVHAAIGSPSIFRLRYGWFSDIEQKYSRIPLMSPLSENILQSDEIEKKTASDSEKHLCPVSSQENGLAPTEDSPNQGVAKPNQSAKPVQSLENKRIADSSALLWDLSNISFGAFLSEASRNVNNSNINCDSFDVAIARFKETIQPTPVTQLSLLDAEETCNAFSFQKPPSLSVSAHSQDAPVASCIQNISCNSSMLHDALNFQAGHIQHKRSLESPQSQQLQTISQDVGNKKNELLVNTPDFLGDSSHFGKQDMQWSESLGYLEYAVPSSKQFIGGDSIGLDGLIASSLDAFQNVSIF